MVMQWVWCATFVCCALLCTAADYKEEFSGKVALVTGGSSGMGYQAALQLAQNGARVIITARDSIPSWFNGSDAAARISDDPLVQENGGSVRFVKADMSNRDDVKALFQSIEENENDLHFAINCAGIAGAMGTLVENIPFFQGPYDPLRNNLYATVYSLMYELRFMNKKNHTGAIVSISSTDGLRGTAAGALYSASKWGIVGLTRSVAVAHSVPSEGMPFIRVNAVAPTLTNTSLAWQQVKWMHDGTTQPWEGDYITPSHPLWQEYGTKWIDMLKGKHMASTKMIADPLLWLLSSEASYITGQTLPIDRGSLA